MERFQLASWTAKNVGIDEHMQDTKKGAEALICRL